MGNLTLKYYKNKENDITYAQFSSQDIPYRYDILDKESCYEIVKHIETKEEIDLKLKEFLIATDNYAVRLATGEAKEEDYSETYQMTFKQIMDKRKECREKINKL